MHISYHLALCSLKTKLSFFFYWKPNEVILRSVSYFNFVFLNWECEKLLLIKMVIMTILWADLNWPKGFIFPFFMDILKLVSWSLFHGLLVCYLRRVTKRIKFSVFRLFFFFFFAIKHSILIIHLPSFSTIFHTDFLFHFWEKHFDL